MLVTGAGVGTHNDGVGSADDNWVDGFGSAGVTDAPPPPPPEGPGLDEEGGIGDGSAGDEEEGVGSAGAAGGVLG